MQSVLNDHLEQRIADILNTEQTEVVFGETNEEAWLRLARAVVRELDLRVEGRQLSDGSGGIMTNTQTGEVTTHSKPNTLQVRWVTRWVNDPEMHLPLRAYRNG